MVSFVRLPIRFHMSPSSVETAESSIEITLDAAIDIVCYPIHSSPLADFST